MMRSFIVVRGVNHSIERFLIWSQSVSTGRRAAEHAEYSSLRQSISRSSGSPGQGSDTATRQ